jgi:hypothetical protein
LLIKQLLDPKHPLNAPFKLYVQGLQHKNKEKEITEKASELVKHKETTEVSNTTNIIQEKNKTIDTHLFTENTSANIAVLVDPNIQEEEAAAINKEDNKKQFSFSPLQLDDPIEKLAIFSEKTKIQPHFIITHQGTGKNMLHTVTLYLGSELCSRKQDRNIKIAKHLAAKEGIVEIEKKFPADIFQPTENPIPHKEIVQLNSSQEVPFEDNEQIFVESFYKSPSFDHFKEIIQECEQLNATSNLQRRFEVYLAKKDRLSLPKYCRTDMQNIFTSLKNLSPHFNIPILCGSFFLNVGHQYNQSIDVFVPHTNSKEQFGQAYAYLISYFKKVLKEYQMKDIQYKIISKVDETNFDLEFEIKEISQLFIFRIRDINIPSNNTYYNYLIRSKQDPSALVIPSLKSCLTSVQRLMRIWRRKFNLLFINSDLLDVIIIKEMKISLSNSFIRFLNKINKDDGFDIFKEIGWANDQLKVIELFNDRR